MAEGGKAGRAARKAKPYLIPRRYYEALHEVAKAINSSLRVERVLRAIVETTTAATEAKGCSVLLLSPDRKKLWHGAAHGLSERYLQKGDVLADASVGEAVSQRKPVAVSRAELDWRVQYREEARREGIGSILSVPLVLKDEVIGVLRVYTVDPRVFPQDEVDFLKAVAELSAIALENARLCEWVEKDYARIRADLAEWYIAREIETFIKDSTAR